MGSCASFVSDKAYLNVGLYMIEESFHNNINKKACFMFYKWRIECMGYVIDKSFPNNVNKKACFTFYKKRIE